MYSGLGLSWSRRRSPISQKLTRHLWEHLLLNRGYELVYFDGLNCFYTANEQAHLKEKLAVPPNIFDDFLPFSQARLQDDLIRQTRRAEALVDAQAVATTEIARLAAELEQTQVNQAELSNTLHSLSEQVDAILEGVDNLRVEARLKALEEHSTKLSISSMKKMAPVFCDMIRRRTN